MGRPSAPRAPTPAELTAAAPHLPLVLYDGACVFCTAQAERVRRIAGGRLRVAPLQTALADVPWVDPEEAVRALQVVDRDGRSYAGAAAIVRLVRIARPWLGWLLLPYHLPGVRRLVDGAYARVAARRYRLGGVTAGACEDGRCGLAWAERRGAGGGGMSSADADRD